jgi:hypothetical protein
MIEAIQFINREGPKYGYTINFNKGTYLLGKSESIEVAAYRKNKLTELGLSPSIIVIHPDNVLPVDLETTLKNYGLTILGS